MSSQGAYVSDYLPRRGDMTEITLFVSIASHIAETSNLFTPYRSGGSFPPLAGGGLRCMVPETAKSNSPILRYVVFVQEI